MIGERVTGRRVIDLDSFCSRRRRDPRHAALTAHLFEQSGWNPHDFVGYRCDTTFPIWLAHYNFNTHFNEPRPAAEPEPHG